MNRFQLDARRLLCPLPVIRTQNKVKDLRAGDIVEVVCTDPGVIEDIPMWCRINGHSVMSIESQSNIIIITFKVGPLLTK